MATNATDADESIDRCEVCGTTDGVQTFSLPNDLPHVDACLFCAPAGGRDPVDWYFEEVRG